MAFPISMPRTTMKEANHKNVCRMRALLAPKAFNTPMVTVRSKISMSNPLTMVKPAKQTMITNITITLKSSNPNQESTEAVRGFS